MKSGYPCLGEYLGMAIDYIDEIEFEVLKNNPNYENIKKIAESLESTVDNWNPDLDNNSIIADEDLATFILFTYGKDRDEIYKNLKSHVGKCSNCYVNYLDYLEFNEEFMKPLNSDIDLIKLDRANLNLLSSNDYLYLYFEGRIKLKIESN